MRELTHLQPPAATRVAAVALVLPRRAGDADDAGGVAERCF